jgi:hypothetical protein
LAVFSRTVKALLLPVLGYGLLWTVSAAAQQTTAIEINDHNQITFAQPTQAGTLTLQPGTYFLQHHTSKGQDFIRFMRVEKSEKLRLTRAYTGWYTDTDLIKVGEAKCQVERLRTEAETTKVTVTSEEGQTSITQVMIKGKRAMYTF